EAHRPEVARELAETLLEQGQYADAKVVVRNQMEAGDSSVAIVTLERTADSAQAAAAPAGTGRLHPHRSALPPAHPLCGGPSGSRSRARPSGRRACRARRRTRPPSTKSDWRAARWTTDARSRTSCARRAAFPSTPG